MRAPGQGIITLTAEATITDGNVVIQGAADDKCKLPAGTAADIAVLGLAKVEGGGSLASGQPLDVVIDGVWPAKASGAITRGDRVAIANSAGAVKTANYAVALPMIVGYALESAADGERVAVLVMPRAMPGLQIQQMVADGAVTAGTIVKVGTKDNSAATGTADPTSGVLGVALNTAADTGVLFVCTGGVVPVTTQGNLSRGNPVTVGDAAGGAKAAAPAGGTNAALVGLAVAAATAPAACNVLVAPSIMQG
jgi:hypothetical protein